MTDVARNAPGRARRRRRAARSAPPPSRRRTSAPGRLHRAFSVLLIDPPGRVLLQQRAAVKTRFPLRWANACCGHPAPGEDAARRRGNRRLREEIGVGAGRADRGRACTSYYAEDPATGRVEYEYDHVLLGRIDRRPSRCCPTRTRWPSCAGSPLRRAARESMRAEPAVVRALAGRRRRTALVPTARRRRKTRRSGRVADEALTRRGGRAPARRRRHHAAHLAPALRAGAEPARARPAPPVHRRGHGPAAR